MPGFNIPSLKRGDPCVDYVYKPSGEGYDGPSLYVETARTYRWLLESAEPIDRIRLYLHRCTRPNYESTEMVVHRGMNEIYFPGKIRWNTIEFSFYEVLESVDKLGNARRLPPGADIVGDRLWNWVLSGGASWRVSQINFGNKNIFELSMLNGDGEPVQTYELYNCWPVKVMPNQLEYSANNIAEIGVVMRYDACYPK